MLGDVVDAEPTQNLAPFKWNKKKVQAAQLLAEDELTDEEIAKKVGVTRYTLWTWKKRQEFRAKVDEHIEEFGEVAKRYAVGHRARRVRWLNDRVARLHKVIRERAADPSMADVPGGQTGLLVREIKGIGGGPNFKEVEEYRVDTGLLKELREHESQAAEEIGQRVTKIAPTTPDGKQPFDTGVAGSADLISEARRFLASREAAADDLPDAAPGSEGTAPPVVPPAGAADNGV